MIHQQLNVKEWLSSRLSCAKVSLQSWLEPLLPLECHWFMSVLQQVVDGSPFWEPQS